jgi:hypothetical protein
VNEKHRVLAFFSARTQKNQKEENKLLDKN